MSLVSVRDPCYSLDYIPHGGIGDIFQVDHCEKEYSMQADNAAAIDCACHDTKSGFFTRYRDFLLSRDTLLTFANAFLMAAGLILSLLGAPQIGHWSTSRLRWWVGFHCSCSRRRG
jgi:hypothetical protein